MENIFDFQEDLIRITEYDVLGKLPNPFLLEDGTRVRTKEDWEKRRKEIYKYAIELQYGSQPPKPEYFRVDCTHSGKGASSYRITAGTKEKQTSFMMRLILPKDHISRCPVVIDGDLCFDYAFKPGYIDAFLEKGIAVALFNRTELANDGRYIPFDQKEGPLYAVYPDLDFGALSAWAWGYSRCVDALETISSCVDLSCIAFTGHSRGAKTAMLAGVLDERAAIVNPNETNAGSCSCYRIHMKAVGENGKEKPSETLTDVIGNFPFWFGKNLGFYKDRENELPFDCHFLKAMVAPRILLVGEAASDIWTNPIGTYQTSAAASEVFKFLGCPENLLWYFRRGFHSHLPEDAGMLAEVISHKYFGTPLSDRYFKLPFPKPELIYDWKAPEAE